MSSFEENPLKMGTVTPAGGGERAVCLKRSEQERGARGEWVASVRWGQNLLSLTQCIFFSC